MILFISILITFIITLLISSLLRKNSNHKLKNQGIPETYDNIDVFL